MIKVGELDKISNNIISRRIILSGGLIKDMMGNYGILITIELMLYKLLVE
jgi:hypothetical protein